MNPVAGKGSALKLQPIIQQFMEDHGIPLDLHLTQFPGHAALIASQVDDPEVTVIAAGGDGTSNEVLNGLMDSGTRRMGVLPVGSGNDFSYGSIGQTSLPGCLELLKDPWYQSIDVGLVRGGFFPDGRYFANGVGIGFDTLVGFEAAKMKRIRGASAYALAALKLLAVYPRFPELKITIDSREITGAPILISLMNGKRMGGAFHMAPTAEINDGLLNYCMTRQGKRGKLLRDMMHYLKGDQHLLEDTFTGQGSRFVITALTGGMAVHADGETICEAGTELEVTCVPSVVQLLSPRK